MCAGSALKCSPLGRHQRKPWLQGKSSVSIYGTALLRTDMQREPLLQACFVLTPRRGSQIGNLIAGNELQNRPVNLWGCLWGSRVGVGRMIWACTIFFSRDGLKYLN